MATKTQKTILVTGGAGFVGSHLCRRLADAGDKVICVDNLDSGHLDNIADLAARPNFEFYEQSVEDSLRVSVDQIYHLACPASPVQYQANPVQTIRTAVFGTANMLELARDTGAVLLQASTSEVYGDPEIHPQTESYWGRVNPIGPRACYDEGKRCAETLCFDYRRQYSTAVKVARIFNTYGPNMQTSDGRVVSNLIVQSLEGRELTVNGGGQQTRSFCYVSDLVRGLDMLMNDSGDFSGPINLGNPHEISIRELADICTRLTDSASVIVETAMPDDDPLQRRPDISLAKEVLGWSPEVSLEDGLSHTVEWFRCQLGL
ncbi:MAG: UDP-glucuronic acid decarboxylase family protein [Pseudomonadota bacterium]